MKTLQLLILTSLIILLSACSSNTNTQQLAQLQSEADYVESNLNLYRSVWTKFANEGDRSQLSDEHFTEDVVLVTSEGDLIGIEALQSYYENYLVGFSEIEFSIVESFGQGDRLTKKYTFKGKHTGDFFGIPATNKNVNLSGMTYVEFRDGRISKEEDFMDYLDFFVQLGIDPIQ